MLSRLKILVFNYNRRLQIDAFLRSFEKHSVDGYGVTVLERNCAVLKKGVFQKDVINELVGHEYVMFCVDDTLFIRDFSINRVLNALLTTYLAIGFSLRLGENTTYCYMRDSDQQVPKFDNISDDIVKFNWKRAEPLRDFSYPMEISSSVYRTRDILPILDSTYFDTPNTLEAAMSSKRLTLNKPYLLCFKQSVAFSMPLTKVQYDFPNNRSGDTYTPKMLEDIYDSGKRIDIDAYSGLVPTGVHQEEELVLI